MVEFFWRKYKERAKDVPEDERLSRSHFTYPGMKPQSPEPAILMLADGAEAASRTLQDYTTDEIQKVVSHVFMVRLLNGQLDESGLTMENLRIVLRSFVDSIHFGHHTRVKYQWQREAKPAEPRPRAEPPRPSKPPAKPQEAQAPSPPPPETEAKEPPEEKDADKAGAVDTEKKADEASGRPSPLPIKSEEPVKEEPQSKEALHPKTLKNNDMRAAVATPVPPEPDDR